MERKSKNEYQITLDKELKKLDREQLTQFVLIAIARSVPFFNKNFLETINRYGYLKLLLYSMETNRYFFESSKKSDFESSKKFDERRRQLFFARQRAHDRMKLRASDFADEHARASGRALFHAMKSAITHAVYFDNFLSLEPDYHLAGDLAHTDNFDNDTYKNFCELLLADARHLSKNESNKLDVNTTTIYGDAWGKWIENLQDS